MCTICFEELIEGQNVRMMTCLHKVNKFIIKIVPSKMCGLMAKK